MLGRGLAEPFGRKRDDFGDWCYARRFLFPGIFTLWLFAFFSPSVILCVDLGKDPTVQYYFGKAAMGIGVCIPVLVLICHIIHVVAARPRFFPTVFSTVVPSVLTLVAGAMFQGKLDATASILYSTDCTTYDIKLDMDNAYRSAAALWYSCLERVATSTNSTVEAAADLIVLEDCSEYTTATESIQSYSRQWAYLATLEHTEECSGWCTPGQAALWTRSHEPRDLCSKAAAAVMTGKVKNLARRLDVVGGVQIAISVWGVYIMSNTMISRGIDW